MTQIPTWSGGQAGPANRRAAPGITIGGRYALRSAVGHGGMGTVWRATDTLLRRDVAVKEVILPPGLAPSDRDAMYERTLREARAAAALQHPAVVQVYDVVTEDGRPWIVMELLDSRSLADMVIEDGPLAPRAVAKIGIALLGALEVAHAIGVLHRDVKPANVLICSDGRCVLTDFGVARMPTDKQLTTPGMVLGSPHFISPERAMGQDFGPPSDLFSLGVTLYTAVEGRPPFDKGDPIETMHAVVEDPPAPMSRAGVLTEVLLGLLEKDPARRMDVTAARDRLRALLAGPLASKAPAHLATDPYAVVPTPRQPVAPPALQPTGQVGGRAMLQPDESLTDRLAQLRKTGNRPAASVTSSALDVPTGAMEAPAGALDVPTGAMEAPTGALGTPTTALDAAAPAATQPWGAPPRPARTPPESPSGTTYSAGGRGTQSAARGSTQPATPGARLDKALSDARRAGVSIANTVKGWPRKVQLAVAGGLAVVVLLGAVLLLSGSDEAPPSNTPVAQPSTPAGPGFETQTHADRGLSVNVPKGWKQNGAGSWIDFTDPEDSSTRIRIIVEKWTNTPGRWAEVAENGLKSRSSSCKKPYARIALTDEVKLAGKPAAELEYTCGEATEMRHGIWRCVVQDGQAYSFYLTTNENRFTDSKKYFEEMVRSFQLTAAG